MKNILLLVHDDVGQEARLQAALDLTRAVSGHLNCVDVSQMPVVFADDGYAGAMLLDDEREREAANRQRLETRLANEDIAWDWVDVTDSIAEAVIGAAGLADLIVLNRRLDAFPAPDMRGIAGAILMEVRKPVVAVPDNLRGFKITGRALVAWDGLPAVTATMQSCVPLLQLASEVELITVQESGDEPDAEEAASYLSRHGVHPGIRSLGRGPADELIARECATGGADWCLLGAYGHGRLRELLFGGVSRRLLTESPIPLILGH